MAESSLERTKSANSTENTEPTEKTENSFEDMMAQVAHKSGQSFALKKVALQADVAKAVLTSLNTVSTSVFDSVHVQKPDTKDDPKIKEAKAWLDTFFTITESAADIVSQVYQYRSTTAAPSAVELNVVQAASYTKGKEINFEAYQVERKAIEEEEKAEKEKKKKTEPTDNQAESGDNPSKDGSRRSSEADRKQSEEGERTNANADADADADRKQPEEGARSNAGTKSPLSDS